MCRLIVVLMVLMAWITPCRGQTFSEWFAQKKTQKKYLSLQIAKLQLYLSYVRKGYEIANTGLTTISDIKDGELKLHDLFFSDLKRVKPLIKNYSKSKLALTDIATIRSIAGNIQSSLGENKLCTQDEIKFIKDQLDAMLSSLLEDASWFLDLLRSGDLQMNDQDRLKRIDQVSLSISSKKDWVTRINADYQLLFRQRLKLTNEMNLLEQIY